MSHAMTMVYTDSDTFAVSVFALLPFRSARLFEGIYAAASSSKTDGEEGKEIFEKDQEDDRKKAEGYQEEGSHNIIRCSSHSTACHWVTL